MAKQPEDPLDGLEERLQKHAKAFDSLLALTPARDHYGSQIDDGLEPSEQWNRKKQTKEQKRAAKKAKLDPANHKTALDVVRDRERKRKRELGIGEDDRAEEDRNNSAAPPPSNKKQKQLPAEQDEEAIRKAKADKRKEKRDAKKQRAAEKRVKQEAKKAAKQDRQIDVAQDETPDKVQKIEETEDHEYGDSDNDSHSASGETTAEMEKVELSGMTDPDEGEEGEEEPLDDEDVEVSSAPTSPAVNSPAFDVSTNYSEASSSSSIAPPSVSELFKQSTRIQPPQSNRSLKIDLPPPSPSSSNSQKRLTSANEIPSGTSSPKLQLPNIDQAQLQERLRNRIEQLRQQRKADGADGRPAKSRQELLEQRRKKEEQRKAHKKELRRQAREDEARKRDEQLRGSGSPLSADIFSRNSPRPQENSFSFSRLAFGDGTAADASLSEIRDAPRKKGAQDPRTALEAAEKKQSRLAGLDAEKRANIADKDMWLNAKKRAHGERVRDDVSLLKRALKRKEKQKGRSEKEWKEREQAVVKGKEMKQKKREANLQKRRDEKGQKGKKKPSSSGKGKKKARPGFEGRGFKA